MSEASPLLLQGEFAWPATAIDGGDVEIIVGERRGDDVSASPPAAAAMAKPHLKSQWPSPHRPIITRWQTRIRLFAYSLLLQMDALLQPQSPQGIGSAKAAISLCGERVLAGKPDKISGQIFPQEDLPWKTRELHQARTDVGRLNETKNSAERERERAESELSRARIVANELASRIEKSNARARAQRSELQPMRKMEKRQEDLEYDSVLQELDKAKKELSRLKLDVASAMEAKTKAEKESEACSSKAMAYSRSVEELKKKVDEADEEHVLVELARMEAEREFRDTEARRAAEADQFAKSIETAKKRIKELRREVNRSKDLETKLRITNSDVKVLQGEMEFVRAMERSYQTDLASKADKKREADSDAKTALESAEAELEAAKQELATIKKESFQFMISMDHTREELVRTAAETSGLKKLEKRAETNIQHLNSKLFKAKSKLEAATVAEERAKAIVSNLSAALQQIQTEIETAKKEKQLIDEETSSIRAEIDMTDSAIRSAEERLYSSMEELEAAKASEAMALRKLSNVAHRTMRNRALSIPHSSTVTISKSEFDYLSQQAAAAQVVATKKVEAAQAWVEALAAEEKEILMKAEFIEKEIRRSRTGEVMELHRTHKSSAVEEEPNERGQSEEEENAVPAKPRKSTRENGMAASARRVTVRRLSTSSATRNARSPSITIKKKKKVMPNLLKFLGDRRNRKQKA
ncbi:hypothetical protein OPV22_008939 [Ensete ventricosum]|uniref:Protein PLASTID MOVEMENT IMPAIRED 2 n=1 Tax=Ensete ventricosum TaxID=4639 RepID=A0AAV8RDE1_ENSVE|nr:hypothetical protein OPV22_008939 [Ensete ventricosum]